MTKAISVSQGSDSLRSRLEEAIRCYDSHPDVEQLLRDASSALASPSCACGTTMVCPDIGCDLNKGSALASTQEPDAAPEARRAKEPDETP
jgi:hypothetical protein